MRKRTPGHLILHGLVDSALRELKDSLRRDDDPERQMRIAAFCEDTRKKADVAVADSLIGAAAGLLEIAKLARGFVEVQLAEAQHYGDASGARDCKTALKKIDDLLAQVEEE